MEQSAETLRSFLQSHTQENGEQPEKKAARSGSYSIGVISSEKYLLIKGEDLESYRRLLIASIEIREEVAAIIASS
jgi:hypothetical protein